MFFRYCFVLLLLFRILFFLFCVYLLLVFPGVRSDNSGRSKILQSRNLRTEIWERSNSDGKAL